MGNIKEGNRVLEKCRKWLLEPNSGPKAWATFTYAFQACRSGRLDDALRMENCARSQSLQQKTDNAGELRDQCSCLLTAIKKKQQAAAHN